MAPGSNIDRGKRVFSFPNRPEVLWDQQVLGLFPGGKVVEGDVQHSPVSSTEVNKADNVRVT